MDKLTKAIYYSIGSEIEVIQCYEKDLHYFYYALAHYSLSALPNNYFDVDEFYSLDRQGQQEYLADQLKDMQVLAGFRHSYWIYCSDFQKQILVNNDGELFEIDAWEDGASWGGEYFASDYSLTDEERAEGFYDSSEFVMSETDDDFDEEEFNDDSNIFDAYDDDSFFDDDFYYGEDEEDE